MQTSSTVRRNSRGTAEFLAGAAFIFASWVVVALVSGLIMFGRPVPGLPRSFPLRMILFIWTPCTGLFAPLYGLMGYFWARHRLRTQLSRGILFMTVLLFVLGLAGLMWIRAFAQAMQGLR